MDKIFYHSWWNKPKINNDRWGKKNTSMTDLWWYAWSVLSVKKYIPDAKIYLYTDDEGKKLLDILPYDMIDVCLNDFNPYWNLWAAGKIKALERAPLGACAIDGDVILSGSDFMEGFDDVDFVTQHHEKTTWYYKERLLLRRLLRRDFEKYYNRNSCNAGFVKINNQEMKDEYIRNYWKVESMLPRRDSQIKEEYKDGSSFCMDLMLEQGGLGFMLSKYTSKYVHDNSIYVRNLDYNQPHLTTTQYTHYIGRRKYEDEYINICKENVKELSPRIFDLITRKEREYVSTTKN